MVGLGLREAESVGWGAVSSLGRTGLPAADRCFACGACVGVCPWGAITLAPDHFGFLAPVVDVTKCVECGACEEVCPVINSPRAERVDQTYPFAAWSRSPRLRWISSSGGAALSFSGYFRSKGYRVAGAVFDDDFRSVGHVFAEDVEDILDTVGSKYIQSNSSLVLRQLFLNLDKTHSQSGGPFAFFGTPCQVAGARNLMERKGLGWGDSDAFFVDFFCHGVPSYLVWWGFLDEIVAPKVGKIQFVDFRGKSQGWSNYTFSAYGLQGTYTYTFLDTIFGQLFLSDLCLRPSCYTCPYRAYSAADVRVGDFWGREFDRENMGVSLLAPISKRGLEEIESNDNLILWSVPVRLLYESQPLMLKPELLIPENRDAVMDELRRGRSVKDIYDRYLRKQHSKRLRKKRMRGAVPPFVTKFAKQILGR